MIILFIYYIRSSAHPQISPISRVYVYCQVTYVNMHD